MYLKAKHFYLILCFLGVILPYSQMIPFGAEYGFDMILLFQKQFSEPATSFFGFDLLVAATATIVFIIFEGKRIKMDDYWIPIVCIFLVGVSLGLPLFLYLREILLEKRR